MPLYLVFERQYFESKYTEPFKCKLCEPDKRMVTGPEMNDQVKKTEHRIKHKTSECLSDTHAHNISVTVAHSVEPAMLQIFRHCVQISVFVLAAHWSGQPILITHQSAFTVYSVTLQSGSH